MIKQNNRIKIFNKIFNKDFNFKIIWPIVLPIIGLSLFGLLLLRSTSFDCASCNETNYITFYNQLTWMGIGSIIFILIQYLRNK